MLRLVRYETFEYREDIFQEVQDWGERHKKSGLLHGLAFCDTCDGFYLLLHENVAGNSRKLPPFLPRNADNLASEPLVIAETGRASQERFYRYFTGLSQVNDSDAARSYERLRKGLSDKGFPVPWELGSDNRADQAPLAALRHPRASIIALFLEARLRNGLPEPHTYEDENSARSGQHSPILGFQTDETITAFLTKLRTCHAYLWTTWHRGLVAGYIDGFDQLGDGPTNQTDSFTGLSEDIAALAQGPGLPPAFVFRLNYLKQVIKQNFESIDPDYVHNPSLPSRDLLAEQTTFAAFIAHIILAAFVQDCLKDRIAVWLKWSGKAGPLH